MATDDNIDIMKNSTDHEEREKTRKKDKKNKNKKRKRGAETTVRGQDLSSTPASIGSEINDTKNSDEKKGKERVKKEKKSRKKKTHKKDQDDDGDGGDTKKSDHESREAIMQRHQEAETTALVGDLLTVKTTTASIPGRAVVESSAIEYYDPTLKHNPDLGDGEFPKPLSNKDVNNPVSARKHDYSLTLLLFYQYVEPVWDESTYEFMLTTLQKIGKDLELTGRMRVAREGLNCTLTASYSSILEYCNTLRRLRPNEFQNTEFKLTRDLPVAQKFPNLKVFKVVELVHYGLEGSKAPPISKYHGTHLEPKEYHKKLAEPNTVIIDVVSVMTTVGKRGTFMYIASLISSFSFWYSRCGDRETITKVRLWSIIFKWNDDGYLMFRFLFFF
jgi:UPF0176 acylphosphatase like domain